MLHTQPPVDTSQPQRASRVRPRESDSQYEYDYRHYDDAAAASTPGTGTGAARPAPPRKVQKTGPASRISDRCLTSDADDDDDAAQYAAHPLMSEDGAPSSSATPQFTPSPQSAIAATEEQQRRSPDHDGDAPRDPIRASADAPQDVHPPAPHDVDPPAPQGVPRPPQLDEPQWNNPLGFMRDDAHDDPHCMSVRRRVDDHMTDAERAEAAAHAREQLNDLFTEFFPHGVGNVQYGNLLANIEEIFALYELDADRKITVEQLDEIYNLLYKKCMNVWSEAMEAGILNERAQERKVRQIMLRLGVSRDLLGNMYANAKCATIGGLTSDVDQDELDYGLWRFAAPDEDHEYTAFQTVIMYLLEQGHKHGYRRYGDSLMLPVYTDDGIATGAWKKVMTFKEYIMQITADKATNRGIWWHLTKDKGNFEACANYLAESQDKELPWLKTDRHIFCFKNCMFLAKEERIVEYKDFAAVFPHGPPVACRYFDMDLDVHAVMGAQTFVDIPTPSFEHLLNSQELSEEVKRWVYALFIGRLLYDVGELDDYQIAPFVKGLGNTGKSKFLETVSQIYDIADVGTISNNIEPKFGLAPIAENLISIADDVRRSLANNLDQSDLQMIISGMRASCARKHMAPLLVPKWKCGIIWSGNEFPDFHDNAGSISRRFVILCFSKMVEKVDQQLGQKLLAELPLLIVKGNWAYRNVLRQYGSAQGIWEILPKEFKEARTELQSTSNALTNLLASDQLIYGLDKYMRLDDLRDMLQHHAKSNGYPVPAWNPDYYTDPIVRQKLKIEKQKRLPWPPIDTGLNVPVNGRSARIHSTWVKGCAPAHLYRAASDDTATQVDAPISQQPPDMRDAQQQLLLPPSQHGPLPPLAVDQPAPQQPARQQAAAGRGRRGVRNSVLN